MKNFCSAVPLQLKATTKESGSGKMRSRYEVSTWVNEIEVVPGTLGGKIALTTNPTGTTSIVERVAYHVGDVNCGETGENSRTCLVAGKVGNMI